MVNIMITKECLERVFNIIEYENSYLLFLKSDTCKSKLLVIIDASTFQIKNYHKLGINPISNTKPESTEMLFGQISDYIALLPYDYGFLNPMFDFKKYQIMRYMIQLGFKIESSCKSGDTYVYEQIDVFGYKTTEHELIIRDMVDIASIQFVVERKRWHVDYVSVNVRNNFDDIKTGINAILKPFFLKTGIEFSQLAEKIEIIADEPIVLNRFEMMLRKGTTMENIADGDIDIGFVNTIIKNDLRPEINQCLLDTYLQSSKE